MMAASAFSRFLRDQSGAITVDWVVMSAAVLGIGISSAVAVRSGTAALGVEVQASLSNASVRRLELNPYRFRAMTQDSPVWWNSIPERLEQAATASDVALLHQFDYYAVHFFELAMERGYNETCDGCRGAGNRLDLMKIQVDELARRGMVAQAHYDTLDNAEARYVNRFGY